MMSAARRTEPVASRPEVTNPPAEAPSPPSTEHKDFWPYVWRALGEHGARLSNLEKGVDEIKAKLDAVSDKHSTLEKQVQSIKSWIAGAVAVMVVLWAIAQFVIPLVWPHLTWKP